MHVAPPPLMKWIAERTQVLWPHAIGWQARSQYPRFNAFAARRRWRMMRMQWPAARAQGLRIEDWWHPSFGLRQNARIAHEPAQSMR